MKAKHEDKMETAKKRINVAALIPSTLHRAVKLKLAQEKKKLTIKEIIETGLNRYVSGK